MSNFRVLVKTSKGNFIYPVDHLGAVLEGNKLRYEFIGNLREGDSILIRKRSSEKITLQDHIIPTLWAGSEIYRNDRAAVFEPSGDSIPLKTKLSVFLQEIIKMGDEKDPVNTIFSAIPESITYSREAVSNWISGNVMLPKKPEVLDSIGTKFNFQELLDWHKNLKEQDYAQVRRIRVLHSGLKALLSVEENKGNYESIEENKDNYSHKEDKLVSLADAMRIIKASYKKDGEELFQEFVTVTKVKSVIELPKVGKKTMEKVGSGESVIEKGILSFKMSDEDKMIDITNRYSGDMPKVHLEPIIAKRSTLIIEAFEYALKNVIVNKFNELEVRDKNLFVAFNAKSNRESIKEALGPIISIEKFKELGLNILLKNVSELFLDWLLLPEDLSNKIQKNSLLLNILKNNDMINDIKKVINSKTFDEFFNNLGNNKSLSELYNNKVESYFQAYDSSRMLKQLFNDKGTFLENCLVFDIYIKKLSGLLKSFDNLNSDLIFESSKNIDILKNYLDFIKVLRVQYLKDNELVRIRRDIKKLGIPSELVLIQDKYIVLRELEQKLLKIYGNPVIPNYHEHIMSLIKKAQITPK
jgi:hypothetical protein